MLFVTRGISIASNVFNLSIYLSKKRDMLISSLDLPSSRDLSLIAVRLRRYKFRSRRDSYALPKLGLAQRVLTRLSRDRRPS